jgi:hypothetical protein
MATAVWRANAAETEGMRVRRKGLRKLVKWNRECRSVILSIVRIALRF